MLQATTAAFNEGKYSFILDQNGNAEKFFKYKGHLIDLVSDLRKVRLSFSD